MSETTDVDVVIVGAGFAGMYQLVRMRRAGFSAVVLETADDVGGTWYWNRYPGARCDILTVDYSYSWDPELEQEWTRSERNATRVPPVPACDAGPASRRRLLPRWWVRVGQPHRRRAALSRSVRAHRTPKRSLRPASQCVISGARARPTPACSPST